MKRHRRSSALPGRCTLVDRVVYRVDIVVRVVGLTRAWRRVGGLRIEWGGAEHDSAEHRIASTHYRTFIPNQSHFVRQVLCALKGVGQSEKMCEQSGLLLLMMMMMTEAGKEVVQVQSSILR